MENPQDKYTAGSLEGETIVERKCPSGWVSKGILVHGHYVPLSFMKSGLIPDRRIHVSELHNMEILDDDVLIYDFPKCGFHWVWEIIAMLLKGKAEYEKRPKDVGTLEFNSVDKLRKEKSPRVFNTHLFPNEVPTSSLEGKGRILFLLRNPKDVAVSYYHHSLNLKFAISPASWDDYMDLVINYGGSTRDWFDYTNEWEKEINKKRTKYLCIYYEEMKKNPLASVKSIAEYLGVSCSEILAEEIVHKCTLESMRSASYPCSFIHNPDRIYRKGEVGDWKNYFTVKQNEAFDEVYRTKMAQSSFHFIFE